jgi:hypothetical protein
MSYKEHFMFDSEYALEPIWSYDIFSSDSFGMDLLDLPLSEESTNAPSPDLSGLVFERNSDLFTRPGPVKSEGEYHCPFEIPEESSRENFQMMNITEDDPRLDAALSSPPDASDIYLTMPSVDPPCPPVAPMVSMTSIKPEFYGDERRLTAVHHEQIVPPKREKRRFEEDFEDDFSESGVPCDVDVGFDDDPTGFKLPASKSPIMEAMVVCGLNGWGLDIVKNNRATATTPAEVVFRVTDFNRYYKISRSICSKQRPTDDLGSRIKSLRRWFVNFPKKKDRCENAPFFLNVKPSIAKKVNEIIERNSRSMGLTKRRRRQ